MRRLDTVRQLSDALNSEYVWRQQEIMNLRLAIKSREQTIAQRTLLRAGVTVSYSHWEGFIKKSTEHLLSFISNQRHKNSELSDLFISHSLKKHLVQLEETKSSRKTQEIINFLYSKSESRANISHRNFVNTQSNLSSTVFEEIASSVGINTVGYKHLYPYIDETIVAKRNQIAHGETLQIDSDDFIRITDRILDLLRMYKNDVENIAALKSYLK
ncbi:MAE_28990/MAE_18760 family HEPN-like nuclease [Vreelandella alkaliphila]|uniref:MAE_28990/MAE_18760 family HEPN-like nuclease n=1 Tax=Vreelandella alkaliphila TaxID=272774 RepID=UPI003FD6FE49